MPAVDETRVAELKALELQRFAGETKVTTEQHVVYAVMVDISNPEAPRAIIHSRDQITAPAGNVVHGDSKQTTAPLDPTAPPFSKATARGAVTGEMVTVGDMLGVLVGFSIDAVAARCALEKAQAEAILNRPEIEP